MIKSFFSTIISLSLLFLVSANQNTYAGEGLAKTYSEFKEKAQIMMQTPEGAAKMYFDAVFCYIDPKTRSEGHKMLRYVMRESANWDRSANYNTFVTRLKNPNKSYIFRSYAEGTSPENGYEMSPEDYSLMHVKNKEETDYTRVIIMSSGADSERSLWAQQFDDGLWHIINNAGSYTDVRQPKNIVDNSHDADYD